MRRQVVGDRLLSAGDDGAVRVWALAGPRLAGGAKARRTVFAMTRLEACQKYG